MAKTEIAYLYKITNLLNSKVYIGVSKNPKRRFKAHQSNSSGCLKLKNAIRNYGIDNFKMEVICKGGRDYILGLEEKLIEAYDSTSSGYNILKGDQTLKPPQTEEYRAKLCESRNYAVYCEENKNPPSKEQFTDYSKPVYVLGFWFPSADVCAAVFNRHPSWAMRFSNSEERLIPIQKSPRKDCKYQGPVYVGGFWWPDLGVASFYLKMSKSHLVTRLDRGFTEEYSVAKRGCAIKGHPMRGA